MTQVDQIAKLGEHMVTVKAGIESLKEGQIDIKSQFTNHLNHHREDSIRTEDRFRKWVWVSIPTIASLIVALIGALYFMVRK